MTCEREADGSNPPARALDAVVDESVRVPVGAVVLRVPVKMLVTLVVVRASVEIDGPAVCIHTGTGLIFAETSRPDGLPG